jgi:CRISPR-associated protein Csb1
MPEDQSPPIALTPESVLKGASPLVLTATLKPVAGLDRFQPAGFPEIGHVIYRAPRSDGRVEHVNIVDSPASMANHLESVCMRGPHDLALDDDLAGMPFLRCVTGDLTAEKTLPKENRELVVTSLTEGHRIASTYFLGTKKTENKKQIIKSGWFLSSEGSLSQECFGDKLASEFGVVLPDSSRAHPPAERWWDVFRAIFKYDPNALVHGVLFPQYQIKIARFLTAHLEAFGAARVDRSGVKFDRLGKTTSGQPIFAVDDATASEIRATFILDVALLQSFGRADAKGITRGLSEKQKEFLVALALWKIDRLLRKPFRYRSGCHLECVSLKSGEQGVKLNVNIMDAITQATFRAEGDQTPVVTDIYWPHDELYREGKDDDQPSAEEENDEGDENEGS